MAKYLKAWRGFLVDGKYLKPSAGAVSLVTTSSAVILTGANCTQSNTSSTGAISQTHQLTGVDCSQSNTSSTGSITVAGSTVLTGADCSQSNTSSTGLITQTHQLTGADCVQSNTSSTGSISVTGEILLAGSDCTQSNACSTGSIMQMHLLTGQDCTQSNTSSTGSITVPGSIGSISAVDIADAVWVHSSADDLALKILEIWGRLGLDPANPLTTTQTTITFGNVDMRMSGSNISGTLTRQ